VEVSVDNVQFTPTESQLLYAFPAVQTDLGTVVWYYTFVHRTYPPTYEEVVNFLTKAQAVGIIRQDAGKYLVVPDWYNRVHQFDETSDNEIEAFLAFEEQFVSEVFPRINEVANHLTQDEYATLLRNLGSK
jgi:hypothetical protein